MNTKQLGHCFTVMRAVVLAASLSAGAAQAAVVNWAGATGFWDAAANWSSNPLLPGAADDVTINVAGVQTITHNAGTNTINSLSMPGDDILAITGGALTVSNAFTNNANTNISGGTLTLNGVSSLNTYSQTGGTLGGTGAVTITGLATWNAGTMTGAGTTHASGGMALGNGVRQLDGGRVLNTAGTTTWSGATSNFSNRIFVSGSSTINNNGTWLDQNAFNSDILNTGGSNAFNNNGTYSKRGAATTAVSIAFNNSGTVNVSAGTLDFASLQGAGTLQTSGGILDMNQAVSTTGNLFHNTSAANSLILGTQTVTVSIDYNNANFGSGNAFNRRANVSATG